MTNRVSDYLVVSDLDQTLLNDELGISERNIEAIRRFHKAGGRFSIATGRSAESVRPYVELLEVDTPVVLCNGSMVYDFVQEQILYECTMPISVHEHTYQIVDRFPKLGAEAYIGTDIYVLQENEQIARHKVIEKIVFEYKPREVIPDGWNKVIMAADDVTIKQAQQFAVSLGSLEARLVKSAPQYLEILPSHANKGTGMLHLAKLLGIMPEKTAAVGDYYNDEEMIRMAGIGAFAENAPEDLKEIADLVVCNYRDGAVADLIEHIEQLCTE